MDDLDLGILYEIRDHLDLLISDRKSASEDDSQEGGAGSVTYRQEWVYCGKECKRCPHGPYWYAYWKEGGRTRSKYVGKELREVDV